VQADIAQDVSKGRAVNVYDNPDKYDLTIVAEIDTGGSYAFDKTVLWRHKSGKFYWAHSSGCS
jgi:hypothetical protein